jgi:murein DD-endopeptidase MepM/ murein hydrolase activator NlpD
MRPALLRPLAALIGLLVSSVASALPDVALDGALLQGALVYGRTTPGNTVQVDGRTLRLRPDGRFVFGLDRDAPDSVTLTLIGGDGVPQVLRYPVAPRQYKIQRLEGLPPEKVNPDASQQARIEREAAANRAARARDSLLDGVFGGFAWPAKGPITGVFGSQRILNGEPKQPHYGVDVAAAVGTPAYAPADGVISLVNDDMFFSGGTLYIDHGYGVSSAFLHLSKILVKPGDVVKKGQKIALIGKTGRVTGPHLDWRVNWFQARVDAQRLVPPMH